MRSADGDRTRSVHCRREATVTSVQHEPLTREELRVELDRLSRERLSVPFDEFRALYEAGQLDLSEPTLWRLALLARLLLDEESVIGNGAASD
jgi:hypothetical protein